MGQTKTYVIKFEVHCLFQNYFNKEMNIKKCMSELHAKTKLDNFCKKKYGTEYQYIIISSCKEKMDFDGIGNIFDKNFSNIFGGKK
jgi:hypothetical protein